MTVIILAEDVFSLVAPGKDGYYMKRQQMKADQISKMVVQTVRQNERDKRDKVDNKTISAAVLSASR